jgi:hypothetical protein
LFPQMKLKELGHQDLTPFSFGLNWD